MIATQLSASSRLWVHLHECMSCSVVVQLMENLDFKQAVSEITAAAKWLREKGAPKVCCSSLQCTATDCLCTSPCIRACAK